MPQQRPMTQHPPQIGDETFFSFIASLRGRRRGSLSARFARRRGALLSGGSVFLALLLDLHVVADRAAHCRTDDCVVSGNVAADATHSSAAQAAGCEAGGGREQRNDGEG